LKEVEIAIEELQELTKVAELVKLLYPYEVVTKKLSAKLDCVVTNNVDVQKFRTLLHESIQNQFLEPTKPIRLAAFLDPRTKDLQIFTEEEKNRMISEARIEYLELATNYYEKNDTSDIEPSDIINADDDIFSDPSVTYLQERSSEQNDDDNITNREFNSYLLLPRVLSETDILQW
ncbi:7430_t:CDS:2, partial [Scutellospora calospora]